MAMLFAATLAIAGGVGDRRWPPEPELLEGLVDHLCQQVRRFGARPPAGDAGSTADLVAALPPSYRDDAALADYPDGGTIAPGTDTGGIAAERAVERLDALYRRGCGFERPVP